MKKTKIIVGVLSLIMAFTLIGCGNNNKNKTGIENNNEIIISGENNNENLEQSETKIKTLEELKIPFELKEENIVEENFEYDYDGYFNTSTKTIEYSLDHEKLKGPIYFGRLDGVDKTFGNELRAYFIEYDDQIVATYGQGFYLNDWKDAISVLDFNDRDYYIELEIAMEEMEWWVHDFYRISVDDFIEMGNIPAGVLNIDTQNDKVYSNKSYIPFIEEKVLTNYYQIDDNKFVRICEFEDGKVSVTAGEYTGDFSEISKNEYTVAVPVYIWYEEDSTSSTEYKMLEVGEKIKILELNNLSFGDAKVQRANGEIVNVTTQVAGRT